MAIHRRDLLQLGGLAALSGSLPVAETAAAVGAASISEAPADHILRIGTGLVELAPDRILSTTTYNGQFPGPLLRLREGERVTVDIHNDTDTPEQLHWHGQFVPDSVDGAAEEGTPFIPAHGMRRIAFAPKPAGFRFYHTHNRAGADLSAGQYSGQVGPVYIEPAKSTGAYDQEVFLVLKEFAPSFTRGGDMASDFLAGEEVASLKAKGEAAMEASLAPGAAKGYEVGYRWFSINGRMLGHGEPIRVKRGERVLFHVLNGSATEIRSLALPGHSFRVVALDGNPVPTPAEAPVLWLGAAERVSAIVEMNHPGVWVMGDLSDNDRGRGMGIVVEYAGAGGPPAWVKPAPFTWDYARFGDPGGNVPAPDGIFDLRIAKHNAAAEGFNRWTINGVAYPAAMRIARPMFTLRQGRRYRLRLHNESDDVHPLHLHRHSFELTRIAGKPTSGILKDVVMLGGYRQLEVDFLADNPGLTLFHCHQQLHMDFGFMALFDYG